MPGPIRRDTLRAVRQIVQRRGENQLVIGLVDHCMRGGLQCVVEVVDRVLVPDAFE